MQQITLSARGLFNSSSELQAPEGSLSIADNVVIDRDNVVTPRRGYTRLASGFSSSSYRANKLFVYQNKLLAHYYTNLMAYYNSGTWTALSGTYTRPSNADSSSSYTTIPVKSAQANQNFYFTTASGVQKMDAYNATPVLSGAYKALDLNLSTSASTPQWLAANYYTAYRGVWGYKDANNNVILGAVSQRAEIQNGGATKSVTVRVTIPSGITTSWFFQLYRAASSSAQASDEMGLVYEVNPTGTDISNGYLDIADIVEDDLRGATLYTSASQEGLAASNEQPPLAKDIAVFKDHMFFANVTSRHRYFLSLLSVGGTNGLAADDTLTIDGITYTAKVAETIASAQFAVSASGSASVAIEETALSLVRVINRHTNSTVYAYYLSGPDDLPGKILLEARSLGTSSFAVTSVRASVSPSTTMVCWSPTLPTSGTDESSTNDAYKNGLCFSKQSQPEAVPLSNFFFCGSQDHEILRILPIRDSLFILKEDGVYRLSGENSGSFRVDLFDSTARLIAPESAVVLNNQVWALTDQGVVSITEGGVQVRSRPIESTLQELLGTSVDKLRNLTFAVGYESDRKYILFTYDDSGDTTATQAFVFNVFTNAWTRWPLSRTCGLVNPSDDKLYFGDADSEYVTKELKSFNSSDQVDYGFSTTISAVSGSTLTLTGSDNISAGDVIYQSSTVFATVASVDSIAGTLVVDYDAGFSAGSADVLKAIETAVAWVPFTAGNPGMRKQFREVGLLFKQDFSGTGTVLFSSDESADQESEEITGSDIGNWGLFAWGEVPWGGELGRRPFRVMVPRNKQRCTQLTVEFRHAVGYANYQLNGISLIAEPGSERFRRA